MKKIQRIFLGAMVLPALALIVPGANSASAADAAARLGMTPSEKAGAGISSDIYIAVRRDGALGSGIPTDPYDGSTANRFEAIFAACANHSNLHFHLGPGIFPVTCGDKTCAISLGNGWAISGAGMNLTTLQLVPNGMATTGGHTLILRIDQADNQVLEDLTLDGNIDRQSAAAGQLDLNGVMLNGRISRVKAINCGNYAGSPLESFWIMDSGDVDGTSRNQLIEDCVCIAPEQPMYVTFIDACAGEQPSRQARGVIIRGCKVYTARPGETFNGHAFTFADADGAVVENNYTDGISEGYYIDTYSTSRLTIRGNTFCRAFIGVHIGNEGSYQTLGTPPLKAQPMYTNRALTIEDNYIDLQPLPADNGRVVGISISNMLDDGVIVRNNTIRLSPEGDAPYKSIFAGIHLKADKDDHFNLRAEIRDNCIDDTPPAMMVTVNPYGDDGRYLHQSFVQSQSDYEDNYSTDGDFVSGRDRSRFAFYADSPGWYMIFSKVPGVPFALGRMSLSTVPLPTGSHGTGKLVDGATTIDASAVENDSEIVLKPTQPGGTPGVISVAESPDAITPGKSFRVISSNKADDSSFTWTVLNGGSLAGEFEFTQPGDEHAGRLDSLVNAPVDAASVTVDQVRSYTTKNGIEVDAHITQPAKVTINYESSNDYYGYYDDLAPDAPLGRSVNENPEAKEITTLKFGSDGK